ncbi:MAG TPA: hypothetical protein VLL52_24125 [Anaerolineae bacterium]|nr:hypothetical protein [Anaerolineae bacterium]
MTRADDQHRADQLEQWLSASRTPTDPDLASLVDLASHLQQTADAITPPPSFHAELAATLQKQANLQQHKQSQAAAASNRASRLTFFQKIKHSLELTTMNRKLSLWGTLALVLLFVFFGNSFLRNQNNNTTSPALVASNPDQLQPLPFLQNQGPGGMGGGGGFGGGGGGIVNTEEALAASDMAIQPDMRFYHPWTEAELNYNGRFPAQPQVATVYQQAGQPTLSLDTVKQYANLLGMTGTIYQDIIPAEQIAHMEASGQPIPASYHIFGDRYNFAVYGNTVQYYRQYNTDEPFAYNNMMPGPQAIPVAENFLRERGLLPADYEINAPYGHMVEVRGKIDGYDNHIPTIYVQVRNDSTIQSVDITIWPTPENLGNYPLITAEQAWALIQEAKTNTDLHNRITYLSFLSEQSLPIDQPLPDEQNGQINFWQRTYDVGETITIYTSIYGYKAVTDDSAPRLLADRYRLTANTDTLNQLAQHIGQPIKIEAVVQTDGEQPLIDVTNFTVFATWDELVPFVYYYGTVERAGDQITFRAEDGTTFSLQDIPAEIASGDRIGVGGYIPADNPNQLNWQHIERVTWEQTDPDVVIMEDGNAEPLPLPSEPMPSEPLPVEPMPGYPGMPENMLTTIDINQIELIYMPVYHTTGNSDETMVSVMILQPAWRFTGTNNLNEIVHLIVQAVSPDYIQ